MAVDTSTAGMEVEVAADVLMNGSRSYRDRGRALIENRVISRLIGIGILAAGIGAGFSMFFPELVPSFMNVAMHHKATVVAASAGATFLEALSYIRE